LYNRKERVDKEIFEPIFQEFINGLSKGVHCAAEPQNTQWKVNTWVKRRPIEGNKFARAKQLYLYCGIIIEHKDKHTQSATTLEDLLR